MTVPVMRTSLKVGDLSIPITEIFNNNDGYVRNELDPILLNPSQPKMHFKQKKKMELNGLLPVEKKPSVQTSSVRSDTMKCPHKIDKSDGTKAECQYVTNRIGNYRRHEKDMHINVNIVECCNLRFLYRADFRLHANENHNGGREFQCLECPATFIRRALLVRHLSVHDPSRKNHKCELCPYSTSHATNLQRHYRVHENQMMAVNWDGEYEEEAYGFSMEEYGGEDEHSFYQYNPYLYESENMQVARIDSANGKRKRPTEEDGFMETQLSMKMPMDQIRSNETGDYDSEQNTSKSHRRNNHEEDESISNDNFSVNSTEEVKEEKHCLLDNPSYYYPSFISFPNWHPISFRNGPSSGFNGLPSLDSALSTRASLDSALSTRASDRNESFPQECALPTRGPVPQKGSLSAQGPELQKSYLSTPGPVSLKSSLSTPGPVPQKNPLSTHGPFPLKCGVSTPVSTVSTPVSKRIKPVSSTVRCSQPAGAAWISTYDDSRPDVKPQFSQSEEHVLSCRDEGASQYHLSEQVLSCRDEGASQYHLSDQVLARRDDDAAQYHLSDRVGSCRDQGASPYHLTELAPLKK